MHGQQNVKKTNWKWSLSSPKHVVVPYVIILYLLLASNKVVLDKSTYAPVLLVSEQNGDDEPYDYILFFL